MKGTQHPSLIDRHSAPTQAKRFQAAARSLLDPLPRGNGLAALLLAIGLIIATLPSWAAKPPAARDDEPDAKALDLFEAIARKELVVTVIPENARRLTIRVENRLQTPATVRLPSSVAAVPVLAQLGMQGMPFFGNNNPPAGNPAPQGLGAPLGGPAGQANNNPFPGGPLFSIPAGKIITRKLPCVCLDFGKPEPRPQLPYMIRPLEEVAANPRLGELLTHLGQAGCDQRVIQLATWNMQNAVSWERLAALDHRQMDGRRLRQYSAKEIEQARRLVEHLIESQPNQRPPSNSLSSRVEP